MIAFELLPVENVGRHGKAHPPLISIPRQATKVISKLVNTAPLAQAEDLCTLCCLDLFGTHSACIWCLQAELLGLEGAINVQGEVLQHFDRIIKRFTGMERLSNLGNIISVQR